ncbi:hypothetical protein [Lactobacillus porci]|uniref:hypothetical protein n=1 Tax=Lactobacillus porci TaxID=2012477 RepID=UPI003994919A
MKLHFHNLKRRQLFWAGILFSCLVWNLANPFSSSRNPFDVMQLPDLTVISANLAWISYYALAELLLLPEMKASLLMLNPFVYVRQADRRRLFRASLIKMILFTVSYNILFSLALLFCSGFTTWMLLLRILAPASLSLLAFNLLLTSLLLLGRDYALPIVIGCSLLILDLVSKRNIILLTNMAAFSYLLELSTILALAALLYFINLQTELL